MGSKVLKGDDKRYPDGLGWRLMGSFGSRVSDRLVK